MKFEMLQQAKIIAMKNNDTVTKDALNNMIDTIQKASITPNGRIEITDQLVDNMLIKYRKIVQEMIDTCPLGRTDLLAKYKAEMDVVQQYAPSLLTDPDEIKNLILDLINGEYELVKSNKGVIMKIVAPNLKARADMKIVNQIVEGMLV